MPIHLFRVNSPVRIRFVYTAERERGAVNQVRGLKKKISSIPNFYE